MLQRRILVVDDVESNLLVAEGLLTPYKIAVDTSKSGMEAIEKIKAGEKYDIIFMDHIMPQMDGIVTVRFIRGMGYDKPIVALTANSTEGQSKMFIKSGFSGFLSKPIDIEHFDACLRQFIPDDLPSLEELLAQEDEEEAGGSTYATNLAESFVRDASNAIEALEPMMHLGFDFDDDAYKRYTTGVHSLKSALANVDEPKLAAMAYRLEQAAQGKELPVILAVTPRFLGSLKMAVEQRRPKESLDIPDFDTGFLHAKLQQIADSCQIYDIASVEDTMDELQEKSWSIATSKLISEISEALLNGDYEKAGEISQQKIS